MTLNTVSDAESNGHNAGAKDSVCQKEMGLKIGVMETGQCSEIVTRQ